MKTSKTPSLSWQNKLISTALASISLILGAPQLAFASLPVTTASNMQSGSVGTVTATTSGGVGALTITTSAANAVINWNNFSDATSPGGLLTSADSISFANSTLTSPGSFAVLNNIQGGVPTILGGTISSAGKIFFLNPAGIIVGAGSVINVGAFYASTVNDLTANAYFQLNGNLAIFNGVTPAVTQSSSGIVYIESGATVTTSSYIAATSTSAANGIVGLASGLQGAPTIKLLNTATSTVGASTTSLVTINQADSTYTAGGGTTAPNAILVEGTITNIGALTVTTMGGSVALNTTTTTNSNPTNLIGVTATGGQVNISTVGGNFTSNAITAGGDVVINTNNTTSGAPQQGSIVTSGTLTTVGNLTLTSASTGTTGAAIYGSGGSAYNVAKNTTINAGSGYLGINGNFGGTITSLVGAGVTLNSTTSATETISSITSTGAVTITTAGNITLTTVNSGTNPLVVNSLAGTATVGTSGTIIAGGASTVNGLNGASLVNATMSASGSSLTVSSSNAGSGSSYNSPVTFANSTVNGNVLVTNNQGTMFIGNSSGPLSTNTLTVFTGNGVTTITGAITANGAVSVTSNGYGLAGLISNNITMASGSSITETSNTSVLAANYNSSPSSAGYQMAFTTNNGGITLLGISNQTTGVNALYASTSNTRSPISVTDATVGVLSGKSILSTTGTLSSVTISGINLVSSNTASGASVSYNSGSIVTTGNVLSVAANGDNSSISITGSTSDLVVAPSLDTNLGTISSATGVLTAAGTGNNLTNSITISTTGNLAVTKNIVAYGISYSATGYLITGNIDSTINANSSIYLKSGSDISAADTATAGAAGYPAAGIIHQVGNQQGFGTLTLISSGNLAYAGTGTTTANMSAAATPGYVTTGNNTTLQSGANSTLTISGAITANTLTITGGIVSDPAAITIAGVNGVNITGNSISLTGANNFSLKNLNIGATGLGGITINSATNLTTNIANASGATDAGPLVVTANGPINLGPTSAASLTVSGNTSVITYATAAGAAAITANYGTFSTTGNVTLNSNGSGSSFSSPISIGTASNAVAVGTVNTVSSYPVSIYANTGGVNLGSITGNTLTVSSKGDITNTGGLVAVTSSASLSAATTGNITLGTNNPITVPAVTVSQGATLSVIGTNASTVTGNGLTLTNLTLSGGAQYAQTSGSIGTANISNSGTTTSAVALNNASVTTLNIVNSGTGSSSSTLSGTSVGTLTTNASGAQTDGNQIIVTLSNGSALTTATTVATTGNTDIEQYNSTIGTLTMSSSSTGGTGGFLTYNALNSTTTNPSSFTVNYGGVSAIANGNAGLNPSNVYSLGNFNDASTIQSNGSFTISNLTDSLGAVGNLNVSANAIATGYKTLVAGTGTLTLGSGIALSGNTTSQIITFTSGNYALSAGGVNDAAGAAPFVYGATTQFIGSSISIGGAGDPNANFARVQFTSNGSVSYSESGSIALSGLSLLSNATGATFTSTSGNIAQVAGVIVTGNAANLTFTAQGTYATSGVVGTVTIDKNNTIGYVSGSYNPTTALATTTGVISISATGNSLINNTNTNINLGSTAINNTGNGATFTASTTTGDIKQVSGSTFAWGNSLFSTTSTGNINLSGAGNNFGAITALASTGNVTIAEVATSTYNKVTGSYWTASSSSGDIILSTSNVSIAVSGANLNAANGKIDLTGSTSGTGFGNTAITLTAGGNASLVDTNSTGTLLGAAKIGGNLNITNNTATGALAIADVTSGTGLSVTGIGSFTSSSGSIYLANSNDAFGGFYGSVISSKALTASVTGTLAIQPGTTAGTASLSATGNIYNVGGISADRFTTLTLVTLGNNTVTLNAPLSVTSGLTIYAPLSVVNLGALSKSIDLGGVSPIITATSNTAPTP